MARRYEGRPEDWTTYVPNVGSERELYSEDETRDQAITCEIHFLTESELKRFRRAERLADGNIGAMRAVKAVTQLFAKNVKNVTNMDSPETGEPITTGEDLFRYGDNDIVVDIAKAITERSVLEAGAAKKLRSPSDSPT